MRSYLLPRLIIITFVIFGIIFSLNICFANSDVESFVKAINKGKDQLTLSGHIESWIIKRGNAEYHLGPGELTLFDFGWGNYSAIIFSGTGRFVYMPPDETERFQLEKYTGQSALNTEIESIAFIFTVELDNLPDTTSFIREKPDKKVWKRFDKTRKTILEHLSINVTNRLLKDFLSDITGSFFMADIENDEIGKLIFCEDPYCEDYYRLYRPVKINKENTIDIINGYSPDNDSLSRQTVSPIDIKGYEIKGKVSGSGKIKADCRINYFVERGECPFLYFRLSNKSKIKKALDFDGKPILVVRTEDEPGFGLVLNKPLVSGTHDFIDIEYEGKPFHYEWEVFYCQDSSPWYPLNVMSDKANYEISFKYPSKFRLSSYDQSVYKTDSKGFWDVKYEANEAGMCFGNLNISESRPNNEIRIVLFAPNVTGWSSSIDVGSSHTDFLIEALIGVAGSKVWFDDCYREVNHDLIYYKRLLRYCPFDSIAVFETPFQNHRGYSGAISLSSYFEMDEKIKGGARLGDPLVRARESAYQWWGHSVEVEGYRNEWLIEGLAQYCGLLSVQSREKNACALDSVLADWSDTILSVQPVSGPMVLGHRLTSSDWDYYDQIAIKKSAYLFNMIRILMHDYRLGTDKKFIAFLQELFDQFKGKTITIDGFKGILEKYMRMDMTWFFDQWVYGTQIPTYLFDYSIDKLSDDQYLIVCQISQENVSDEFKMMLPVTVLFDDGTEFEMPIWIDQPRQELTLPLLSKTPKEVIFNTFNAILCNVKSEQE